MENTNGEWEIRENHLQREVFQREVKLFESTLKMRHSTNKNWLEKDAVAFF
jgi:hypothetical protein